ncbi:site-specific integrase [Aureimonas altamirensis]|uniref:site-specific integrase n=1 Tax=Aureimonas altamirensis TaxID=370622 RepID=UPI001E4AEDCC|nr:site-specific integrase [Aureimonas altamirensis]UHD45823.1 site-specific integrase [Aureimonas altamirensis]
MVQRDRVTLTKKVVDAAEKQPKRYHVWDKELSGFALRVEPSGVKTFVIKYRAGGGGRSAKQHWLIIGRFGPLTADQARKIAKAKLGSVAAGADPASELLAKRREMTVSALVDLYEKEGCVIQRGKRQGQPMKPLTKQLTLARLRNHVVPLLGTRRAPEINPGDIERFVADVTAGKTAKDEKVGPRKRVIVRGGDGAARKVVRDLSAVFSFAQRREIVKGNPCETAAVRKTDNRRERYLTLDEVTRLGAALDELEAEGVNAKAVNIARLWALTGCRRDEIAGLRWSELFVDEGLLMLEDSKTRKSLRPLGAAAVSLLKSIDKIADSDFVFPAEWGDSHYQGTKSIWAKAIAKAKLPGVTPHTLRHTVGSTATSNGEALALTGAILGHANPRSTAIYAHVQTDPSRQAAERVSARIAAALAGKSENGKTPAKAADEIEALVRSLVERLSQEGIATGRIGELVGELVEDKPSRSPKVA